MKKIVMFDGDIETQQYFTYRMREEFERLGHEVYTFNLSKTSESLTGLMRFVEKVIRRLSVLIFTGSRRGMFFRTSRTVPGSGMRSTAPAIIL